MQKQQIQQDLKKAMMERNSEELSILRVVMAALQNREIDKRARYTSTGETMKDAALTDEEILDTIAGEVKKLNDALALFEKGGRADLIKKQKRNCNSEKIPARADSAPRPESACKGRYQKDWRLKYQRDG